ncbi:MAG: RluA family pseudouridine synthase [Alphaproteobacteria bacterium]|nr:MAG: RluA family pseudouridine synthase [Alphaproteobacteria bacterium]
MSQPSRLQVEIGADPPGRLDKALAREVPESAGLSRTRLARLIAEGHVRRAGVPVTEPKAPVQAGELYEIALPEPEPTHMAAEEIPLAIVHEDEEVIVIDKPAGMVVHPAPGSPSGTLVNALLAHCGGQLPAVGGSARPGIVHRIDKETSGLLVVARTDRAQQALAAQFAAHTVHRRYVAFCHGVPEASDPRLRGLAGVSFEAGGVLRIDLPLGRHPVDRQRQAVQRRGGRHAITRARVAARHGAPPAAARLDCWLETGRTHQIRAHLAHVGHPLIGDRVYGRRRRAPASALGAEVAAFVDAFPRQALHAAELGFVHPVSGKELHFTAPLPADLAQLQAMLERAPRERQAN